jgi:enamine deaminase RidA (YjgF/YER057c/UK114 family)
LKEEEEALVMRGVIQVIKPLTEGKMEICAANCITQVENLILSDYKSVLPIRIVFFVNARNNSDYQDILNCIRNLIGQSKLSAVPFSVVSQAPYDTPICMEVEWPEKNTKVEYKKVEGISYALLHNSDCLQLIASGIGLSLNNKETANQYAAAFESLKNILAAEGMSFQHIVRQWNYIAGILANENQSQHYQTFNDVRTHYYNTVEFDKGYPAATGIGENVGNVCIDVIAVKGNVSIVPIKNPGQIDAHHYDADVLKESNLIEGLHKSTPKFERAKYCNGRIYISGTASIIGQKTVCLNDVEGQTDVTLDNIEALISNDNLCLHEIKNQRINLLYLRLYVARNEYFKPSLKLIEARYPDIPVIAVVADVCRNDLLVEIEGIAEAV